MSEQLELPILMPVKSDYAKLSTAEQHLIAVAYLTEPCLALANEPIPPTRHLRDARKHRDMRRRKAELEAAIQKLLKQGWVVRTMTNSVALTKAGRKAYEAHFQDLIDTGQMW